MLDGGRDYSSTCVRLKEERIDGEDEEASGKKENFQSQD
jgi:hypothetical protein